MTHLEDDRLCSLCARAGKVWNAQGGEEAGWREGLSLGWLSSKKDVLKQLDALMENYLNFSFIFQRSSLIFRRSFMPIKEKFLWSEK